MDCGLSRSCNGNSFTDEYRQNFSMQLRFFLQWYIQSEKPYNGRCKASASHGVDCKKGASFIVKRDLSSRCLTTYPQGDVVQHLEPKTTECTEIYKDPEEISSGIFRIPIWESPRENAGELKDQCKYFVMLVLVCFVQLATISRRCARALRNRLLSSRGLSRDLYDAQGR